jgi:Rho termination factor, N-terminal domain
MTTPELSAMTVVNLRKLAKDNGLTLPSNSKKAELVNAIMAAPATPPVTPPATPPVTPPATPPVTPPAKSSPVRNDVTPEDVKPDNSARIAELRANAEMYITDGVTSAVRLAATLAELYPLKPWIPVKLDVHKYFQAMGIDGDNFKLPATARKQLVKAMFTRDANVPAQHVAWMAGAGLKTINSDKSELGFTSETRSAAQQANAAARNAGNDDAETPASDGPVTRMVPVVSMTSVRAFINSLTDEDMLNELSDLVTDRIGALAQAAA